MAVSVGREPLLKETEVARILGVSSASIRNSRSTGVGGLATLPYIRVGGLVRYELRAIDAWLDARRGENAA